MKKESLKLRLPYFFGQQIRSKDLSAQMPILIKHESDGDGAERVIEDILRWADGGGKLLDIVGDRTASSNPEAAWETGNKSESQWNGKVSGNNDSPVDES